MSNTLDGTATERATAYTRGVLHGALHELLVSEGVAEDRVHGLIVRFFERVDGELAKGVADSIRNTEA
ncbi:hypothetical protein GCM10009759_55310 [Kitasatospora saccharophila]|uniref:Uncharacterized protein n=1 Tax=Kitasatospora saccharophila TaxID=407973 RepID=A0ABN2XK88_9ACTN